MRALSTDQGAPSTFGSGYRQPLLQGCVVRVHVHPFTTPGPWQLRAAASASWSFVAHTENVCCIGTSVSLMKLQRHSYAAPGARASQPPTSRHAPTRTMAARPVPKEERRRAR